MDALATVKVQLPDGSVNELKVEHLGELTIGRDETCHVVLPSKAVSRQHVRISRSKEGFVLTDDSANGTVVGGTIVLKSSATFPAGTPFKVGPYLLRVDWDAMRKPTANGVRSVVPRREKRGAGEMVGGVLRFAGTTAATPVELRRRVHRMLLDHLDLATLDRGNMDSDAIRPKVLRALKQIITNLQADIPSSVDHDELTHEMSDEVLGLGPLERLLADPTITEIMVVDPSNIYVERRGKICLTDLRFTDSDSARSVIERIVTPLGRRIDESTPLVDARLKDGSRVNAIIPPLAIKGPCITIRKFHSDKLGIEDLVRFGSMDERMGRFLQRCVESRKNIVISGGTGSGKTTLLNALSAKIPGDERIVTIEDAAELQLAQPHVVSLETRPANMEGKGEYSIRDLVKNALRMRPDRIVVGECRGGEALDMLQAMNTGHEGSMTTTHANSPEEGTKRLETLSLMSGIDLPGRAIREQIATSVDIVLQQTRFSDGSRRVTSITELAGLTDDGDFDLREVFLFRRTGTTADGTIEGEYCSTGYLPSFLDDFIRHGLVNDGEYL
ncbi:MAG: ATPase, T2SS/T4P/T4SS family [Polyangiales bacterium]